VAKEIEGSKHKASAESIARVAGDNVPDNWQRYDWIIRAAGIVVGEMKTGLTGKKTGNSGEGHDEITS
jgi:hypothetical protein